MTNTAEISKLQDASKNSAIHIFHEEHFEKQHSIKTRQIHLI